MLMHVFTWWINKYHNKLLISICDVMTLVNAPSVRAKKSDYGDKDETLVKVCKVTQKNPKPWYYALVMTPVMAVIINILFFLAYILILRILSTKHDTGQDDAEKSEQVESNVIDYDNNLFNN